MVSRNHMKSTTEATRVSTRISMRLKSSKSAASISKVTKVTSKTASDGVTKKTMTTVTKKVSTKVKAKAPPKKASKEKPVPIKGEEKTDGEEEEGEDGDKPPKLRTPKYDPSPVETTVITLPTTLGKAPGEDEVHPGITHLLTINPSLTTIVTRHPCTFFSSDTLEPANPFHSLCSGIIAQQVSSAAATSIKSRFIALFNDQNTFPIPSDILTKDIPTLRTAGLSQRKAEYITGLAELFVSGELTNEFLLESSDEAVTEKLIKVRGLGLWSIQMFLMFALKRTDVFATGDLGLQRGMAILAGRDVNKLKFSKPGKAGKWKYMAEDEMIKLASVYSPYRSLLSWYLWRLADTDVDVFKGVDKTKVE
ncbi:3-methyladenine DNA glycosylase [Orbilia javanica]|uniref:3-methyladenine DNA glycosylase n=1 Tax=Orbilia javanica TaxID=47235 RepID=A0AAN8NX14_9PEZI